MSGDDPVPRKDDDEFMEAAFALAEEALSCGEVPVGRGRNRVNETCNPMHHAEMVAINEMSASVPDFESVCSKFELFVTLEPCIMCASALYQLGIRKITYGAVNDRFGGIESVGGREKYNEDHVIELVRCVAVERSVGLLRQFYRRENQFAPEKVRKIKIDRLQ